MQNGIHPRPYYVWTGYSAELNSSSKNFLNRARAICLFNFVCIKSPPSAKKKKRDFLIIRSSKIVIFEDCCIEKFPILFFAVFCSFLPFMR